MHRKVFQPLVNALDFFKITISFFPWYLFGQQRNPMGKGLWAASTGTSPEEKRNHYPTPLSTWNMCSGLVLFMQKRCEQTVESPQKGHKDFQRTRKPVLWKWLRQRFCVFSLEKTRLSGDLVTVFQYLKGAYKEVGDSLFIRSHMENMRGNGTKYSWGNSSWR